MATDWVPWTVGPLFGAAAGAAATWLVERHQARNADADRRSERIAVKVQEHDIRIALLEKC